MQNYLCTPFGVGAGCPSTDASSEKNGSSVLGLSGMESTATKENRVSTGVCARARALSRIANMSRSEKLICAVAVLIALLVIAFIIVTILVHKGIIQVPGITQKMACTVLNQIGIKIFVASVILLSVGLCYLKTRT